MLQHGIRLHRAFHMVEGEMNVPGLIDPGPPGDLCSYRIRGMKFDELQEIQKGPFAKDTQ